nr:MAG TPA: hypothetical protein [Caudoviricetes sp.]
MKLYLILFFHFHILSLSSRRAWIEMPMFLPCWLRFKSRSPHGDRGLKFLIPSALGVAILGRSPHGERGLKSDICF